MTERQTLSVDGLVIAILGGTGERGRGLLLAPTLPASTRRPGARRRPAGHRPGTGAGGPDSRRAGVYAGRLRNSGQVEALTANLVSINRRYKAYAGLRVTDI